MPQYDVSLTRVDKGPGKMLETRGAETDLSSARSKWRIDDLRHWPGEIYNIAPPSTCIFSNAASLSSVKA